MVIHLRSPLLIIYIVLISWDVKSKRKLFLQPAVPGTLDTSSCSKGNGMLQILMERMDNGKRVVSRGLRLTVLFNVWLTKQRRKI